MTRSPVGWPVVRENLIRPLLATLQRIPRRVSKPDQGSTRTASADRQLRDQPRSGALVCAVSLGRASRRPCRHVSIDHQVDLRQHGLRSVGDYQEKSPRWRSAWCRSDQCYLPGPSRCCCGLPHLFSHPLPAKPSSGRIKPSRTRSSSRSYQPTMRWPVDPAGAGDRKSVV